MKMGESTPDMNITVTDMPCYNTTYSMDNDTCGKDMYDASEQFLLPWWQQTIFYTAFIIILVVSAGGNLIVMWIVLAHKRMRTVTNYFLVNLAIADFLISILNMPFTQLYLMYQLWWFGTLACMVSLFVSTCTISVSVLTFMAIAIDRYSAILYPLRPRMPKRHVLVAIIAIWVISICLSLPNLVYGGTTESYGVTTCSLTWESEDDLIYAYLLMILNYVFPLLTLTITYTRVGIELWGSQAIGEETSVQNDRVKSKRKVVKMMILVVVIFAICWLPTHVYFLVSIYFDWVTKYEYIQQLYITIYLMAMSNSMYNPIIYCWMNSRFREGFIHVFCWCPCKPCRKSRPRLRFRRTLFPTSANTMMEKYGDRNGSTMTHTMTEYVDMDVHNCRRSTNSCSSSPRLTPPRKKEDFV